MSEWVLAGSLMISEPELWLYGSSPGGLCSGGWWSETSQFWKMWTCSWRGSDVFRWLQWNRSLVHRPSHSFKIGISSISRNVAAVAFLFNKVLCLTNFACCLDLHVHLEKHLQGLPYFFFHSFCSLFFFLKVNLSEQQQEWKWCNNVRMWVTATFWPLLRKRENKVFSLFDKMKIRWFDPSVLSVVAVKELSVRVHLLLFVSQERTVVL